MSPPRRRPRKARPVRPAAGEGWKREGLAGLGLLALTVIAYLPVVRGGFLWDDDLLITANGWVKSAGGLAGIWSGAANPDYLPVVSTLFWGEWRLWGMNAAGYHIVNILLHCAAVLLLWRLLARMKTPGAWFAAALFAVHPVAVGSVAWIAEGKNTLALVLALVSFHFYIGAEKDRRSLVLSLVAFVAALLSKSAIVMLPFVYLLYEWWRNGRFERERVLRLIPFFVLAATDAGVTVWFQAKRAISGAAIPIGGPIERIESAAVATAFYFWKALIPVHLSMIYAPPSGIVRWIEAGIGAAFWIALLIVAWRMRSDWGRGAVFGFGSFGLLLLPVLGFFKMYFFVYAPVADHLEYVALPAFLATVAAGLSAALDAARWKAPRQIGSAVVLMVFGFLSWCHAALYADGLALWSYAARFSPECFAAHYAYAGQLSAAGQSTEAALQYEQAVQLNPGFLKARLNYAILLDHMGRGDESIVQFHEAIGLSPDFAGAHEGLAVALLHRGQVAQAINEFQEALRLDAADATTHNDFGSALQAAGRESEAIGEFEKAVALDPGYADGRLNLGLALYKAGDARGAVIQLTELTRLQPDSADAHSNLGSALYMAGRGDDAVAEYQEALRIDPGNANARRNLAGVLSAMGR